MEDAQTLNPSAQKNVTINLPTYLAQRRTNIVILIENQKEGTLQIFDEMATMLADQSATLIALKKEKEALGEEIKKLNPAVEQPAPTK